MTHTYWWPVTDEEWERINFPEKYQKRLAY